MSGKLLSVLLLSGLAAPASAQAFGDDADAGIQIAPAKKVSFFAHGHTNLSFEGRTKSRQGGQVTSLSLDAGITAVIPVDDGTDMRATFAQSVTTYDFNGFDSFGTTRSDPIDVGLESSISVSASHSIDRQWALIGGANITSGTEPGADYGDSLTFGGFFGIMHHVHEDLSVGFAIAGSSQLEDDANLVPLPTVMWNIDDYWTLNIGGNTTVGDPGIEITHELNDDWDVGASLTVDQKQFRFEDDNSAIPDGVLEDLTVPLMFVVTWSPEPNFSISGNVGANVYREFELRDDNRNTLSDAIIKPTFAFGVSGEFRF